MSPHGVPAPRSLHLCASKFQSRYTSSLSRLSAPGRQIEGHRLPAWLVPILAGGALLRFVGLGKESIWLDEATSLIIARMNLSSVVAWAAADVHPPLYYLALHWWLCLGETEFAIRALSAVLGVITLAVVYVLGRELFNARVGLLSAVLLAAAPLHVWYSQEARMYAMLTMLSLLAGYWMLVALRQAAQRRPKPYGESRRYWIAYVFAAVLSLYTHYFALVALAFFNLFALYWLWRHPSRAWRGWLAAQVVVVLLFLPWMPTLYRQVTTGGGGWVERAVGKPGVDALVDTWLYFSVGLDSQLYPAGLRRVAYLLFAACILTAVSRMLYRGEDRGQSERMREGILFCLICGAAPVLTVWLLSQAKPMYSIRFLLPFLPPYCILIAVGIDGLPWKRVQLLVAMLLIVTLMVGNWSAWRVEQNPDWRGLAAYVLEHAQPSDVVLFSPRWNVKPFDYYNRGRVDVNMDLPIPVTEPSAQKVIADISQQYRRVWLVWQQGHYSDPDGIAKQILDSQYRLDVDRGFRGVDRVILYDLSGQSGR
jgi:mannosyltransferase